MLALDTQFASLSDLAINLRGLVSGDELEAVERLAASIAEHGLLCPVVVAHDANGYQVLDGRKRMLAMRRLAFRGQLGRLEQAVPFITADGPPNAPDAAGMDGLALLAPSERVQTVHSLARDGLGAGAIASRLHVAADVVAGLLSIERVSIRLQNLFYGGHLDAVQIGAFACLSDASAQDRLLDRLGPFVGAPDILAAIRAGETVLRLGESECSTLILPSMPRKESVEPIAAPLSESPMEPPSLMEGALAA